MKTKIGRPKLPKGELRKVFPLRLSDAERADYESAAERSGQKLPKWMRSTLTAAAKKS